MSGKYLLDTNIIICATAMVNNVVLILNDKQLSKVNSLKVVSLEDFL